MVDLEVLKPLADIREVEFEFDKKDARQFVESISNSIKLSEELIGIFPNEEISISEICDQVLDIYKFLTEHEDNDSSGCDLLCSIIDKLL